MTTVQSLSVFSVAASLLTLAPCLPAAATECGVKHTRLTAPFTGQWRGQDELYDIAQGKLVHTFTVHFVTGDEVRRTPYHFIVADTIEAASDSLMDCRVLTASERDTIDRNITELAGQIAEPGSQTDRENREEIALFRASLAHAPYRMLAVTHYEDKQWLILLGKEKLLDIWYGEGDFSVHLFERAKDR